MAGSNPAMTRRHCEPTGPAFGRPDDKLREPRRTTAPAPRPSPSRAASRPPQDDGKHARLLLLRARFSPEPSDLPFQNPPLTNAGPFLFFPLQRAQKEAERRQTRVSSPHQPVRRVPLSLVPPPFAGEAFEGARSPVGVPPRLSPRGLTSPQAQLRPCFLGRGLSGCCPPSPVPVQ